VLNVYWRSLGVSAAQAKSFGLSNFHLIIALRAAVNASKRGAEHGEGSQPDEWDKGWEAGIDFIREIADELENPQ
jgi:hypothetical protein